MTYRIKLQAEAVSDVQEIFQWYEKERSGLGFEFLDELEDCYLKLSKNPKHFTYINDNYRRIQTSRFPYLIIYEIEADMVIVNTVRHERHNPEK